MNKTAFLTVGLITVPLNALIMLVTYPIIWPQIILIGVGIIALVLACRR